ncbi:hypothetical protein RPMA_14520 [Tardiphaga alba]|uniref:Uncharacterized protein n=1 Tax=Tardiphaga alba TaxID=340268 RepID=A0ABX8A8B9_9BRAD|nr:hypothetical protein [Tardiphaga alba]QUS39912.1 hypothetical protein RPMA_14520 [Tardiphaga alba]
MDDQRLLAARQDIERRVAAFRNKQARLTRERETYYDRVIEQVRSTDWNEFVTPPPERKSSSR